MARTCFHVESLSPFITLFLMMTFFMMALDPLELQKFRTILNQEFKTTLLRARFNMYIPDQKSEQRIGFAKPGRKSALW